MQGYDAFSGLDAKITSLGKTVDNLATQVKRTGSPRLAHILVEEEAKVLAARKQRAELANTVRVGPFDEAAILQAAKNLRGAIRSGDRERMLAFLPEVVSALEVDWTKRKKPPVTFKYF